MTVMPNFEYMHSTEKADDVSASQHMTCIVVKVLTTWHPF